MPGEEDAGADSPRFQLLVRSGESGARGQVMYQGAAAAGIPGLAAVPQEGRRDRTGLRHPDRRAAGRQRALPGRACSVVWSWLAIVDRAWRLVMLPRTSGGGRQGEHMTVRAELAAVSGKAIAGSASYVRLSQHRQDHAG